MATTAVVAEILIIGLQAEAWLALLLLAIVGTEWIDLDKLAKFAALDTIVVVAVAYVLGILVDRMSDSLFDRLEYERPFRWLNRRFGRWSHDLSLPAGVGSMRMRVLKDGGAMAGFLDYQRSRMRIVRGTAVNVALSLVAAPLYLGRNAEAWHAIVAAIALLVLLALTLTAGERIKSAYLERLVDAYKVLVKDKDKKPGSVVAAICHRDCEDGPELLLVRTSDGRRWTFPKGHVEKEDESARAAAAREAREEAGISGEVSQEPIAKYRYRSRGGIDEVDAYLLAAQGEGEFWLAEPWRRPEWMSFEKARRRLRRRREPKLADEHLRVIEKVEERLRPSSRGERG